MTAAAEMYVDNNKTIYVTDFLDDSVINLSDGAQLEWGLADMNELPGQSTLFINKVRFGIQGYVMDNGVNAEPVRVSYTCGVIMRDLNLTLSSPKTYQDYQGWPLKGGFGYMLPHSPRTEVGGTVVDNPVHSKFSKTFTYSPRKALLLNREQNLVLNIKNDAGGCPINALLTMEIQCKRGG